MNWTFLPEPAFQPHCLKLTAKADKAATVGVYKLPRNVMLKDDTFKTSFISFIISII